MKKCHLEVIKIERKKKNEKVRRAYLLAKRDICPSVIYDIMKFIVVFFKEKNKIEF